uniref:Uncharacterized protein n=1 Tax=Anguilla anguilla TaxID=7936 RepID=A0A0E9RVZ1_ANGAN
MFFLPVSPVSSSTLLTAAGQHHNDCNTGMSVAQECLLITPASQIPFFLLLKLYFVESCEKCSNDFVLLLTNL